MDAGDHRTAGAVERLRGGVWDLSQPRLDPRTSDEVRGVTSSS